MLTIQHGHCCRSLLIALLLTLLGVNTTSAQVETLDQIVAIVDDDIILASELRERLTLVTQNLERQDVELPEQEILVRETLDRLILESIQMQLALRYGIRIPDAQLDDAMRRMAGQNNLTLEQFRGAVEAQGESFFAMREQVRQELTLQRVQQGNVNRGIEISEQEVDNFMGTDEGEAMTQPEFRVVQALVEVSKNDSKAEKASKEAFVDRVLAQILAGQAFDEAVSGTDLYAFKGGDLGWRKLADIPSMFTDVIPALGAGDTAKVTSGAGFHLVYLVDERGRKRMIDQTEVRHILIKPNEVLDDQWEKSGKVATLGRGTQASGSHVWMDTQLSLVSSSLIGLAVSFVLSFLVLVVATRSFVASLISILAILGIVAVVLGSMVLGGRNLGFMESICVTVVVGLAVDYVVHYGIAFVEHFEEFEEGKGGGKKRERTIAK